MGQKFASFSRNKGLFDTFSCKFFKPGYFYGEIPGRLIGRTWGFGPHGGGSSPPPGSTLPMEAVLKVEGLSKRFGKVFALDGVSFSLRRGEVLGVVGPNGAGKTTLIHCLLGLITPSAGKISYFGLELSTHRSLILERVNFASNYVALPLSLTLEENLLVYAHLYGVKRPRQKVEELLKLFGLYERRHKPARALSSGQMMRLCLAKALINEPEVLLLDEPTAGLDPEIAHQARELILDFAGQKGRAVLFTSHNLLEVERISHRILILEGGRIKALGKVPELLAAFGARNLEELYFRLAHEA